MTLFTGRLEMPGVLDVLLVVIFAALWPLYTQFIYWPRHEAAVAAGDPRARSRMYARVLLEEWALTLAAVSLFVTGGRSLSGLWLAPPSGWRLAVGLALPVVYIALVLLQGRAVVAR